MQPNGSDILANTARSDTCPSLMVLRPKELIIASCAYRFAIGEMHESMTPMGLAKGRTLNTQQQFTR